MAALLSCSAVAATHAQQRDSVQRARRISPQDSIAAVRALQQRFGRNVSRAQIVEQLRQSGMTRAEVRARLKQYGYDPALADQYFDVIERGAEPLRGDAPDSFLRALGRIGIAVDNRRPTATDTMLVDSLVADSLEKELEEQADTIEVFGVRLFKRNASQFEPVTIGPVDPGYRLGPGDEVTLVLTGDVEDAYPLLVSREGILFIPTVGQLNVNGLTLAQLEDRLYGVLGRVYSGVSRSANATTRFQVSLGELRTNQIFVIGDVARPAAYQISSVGTVLNALYRAGGPTTNGTFRNIEVRRGDRVVQYVDLYDYLVRGENRSDIRLENNDRVFVPPVGAQARLEGAVRRPGIYEVKAGEGVRELVGFAGGLKSDAIARRVQIDRIKPPAERKPGENRELKDVNLAALTSADASVTVLDGDIVTVFGVTDERRNRVFIDGEVRNPGKYEWRQGLSLGQLIENAEGFAHTAYTPRVLIYRLNEQDGSRMMVRASAEVDGDGKVVANVTLADQDSVIVFSRGELTNPESISIDGFVKEPGMYALADGMTLKDLILLAGGFVHGAYFVEAEVSRQTDPLVRTDTTAIVRRYRLDTSNDGDLSKSSARPTDVPAWYPAADEVTLSHGDRVFIRRAPGYGVVREVKITGEVMQPGTYVLRHRSERISELLQRAGGMTNEAYADGMHVVRGGRLVAAELARALEKPKDRNNIVLQAGDSIHVPPIDPMVSVSGAVNYEARVLYRPGSGVDYYIQQAGGYTALADKGRLTVTYANGERAGVKRFLTAKVTPDVKPGSVIMVPAKPAEAAAGTNWEGLIMRGLTITGSMLTVLIAIKQLQ